MRLVTENNCVSSIGELVTWRFGEPPTNRLTGHGVLLDLTQDATRLAADLIRSGGMPENAKIDALHIAVAAVHGMDYLVSWNCRHIANATMRGRIEAICRNGGFEPPVICTPLELTKESML